MSKYFNLSSEEWLFKEIGFKPAKQGHYESLFTLGNGYLGVRGSLEENPHHSYRGVFIAGVFDKSEGYVNELVKTPGWIDFVVTAGDTRFAVDHCKVLSNERILDIRKGVLHRCTRLKDNKGRILRFESRRVVFSHQVRGAILDINITPENFTADVTIYSGLNGDVTNTGYFPNERVKHLNLVTMKRENDLIYLEMKTRDKGISLAIAATTVFKNPPQNVIDVNRMYGEKFAQVISFKAEKGKTYNFNKWISIFTSREGYERQLHATSTDLLRDMVHEGLDTQLKKHIEERDRQWQLADIEISGDKRAQKGIRFNLYHLMIAKPHHDPTVSIGAKLLTGEGYKGHVFWDTEIFLLPFYTYVFPEDAKRLLMYRYYTLKGALKNAKDYGYKGAKIAWESADTGEETTPAYGLRADGSSVKIFTGDEEHHIVSDVVHGIYKYMRASADDDFLFNYAAEIVFQTARFWLSRVEKRRDRYEIRKVIGPDEFHEHVDNNAFTNFLVMWHLEYAHTLYAKMKKEAPDILQTLAKKIKLKPDEMEKMKIISKTIYFPYDQKTELIEQFEGYFTLKDASIKKLNKQGLPEFPKGIDCDALECTRFIKQADVVLLLYLFLDRFPPSVKKKNYDYYEARTMHKSSLSPCIYALMGLETGDHKRAYDYFMKTSYIDILDVNRNTCDGIHAAANGGAWMTVVHGFAGMRVRRGEICFDPWLPQKWKQLNYSFFWKGSQIAVSIARSQIVFSVLSAKSKNINVVVQGKTIRLAKDKQTKVRLKKVN